MPRELPGLSPRGRGKRAEAYALREAWRSIPAWAGETAITPVSHRSQWVYPRVGGGNAMSSVVAAPSRGLSPRGRGKLVDVAVAIRRRGSIPAWAGETERAFERAYGAAVYPRVGGGNPAATRSRWAPTGLSPRGRGKRKKRLTFHSRPRSIPAWAGETAYAPTASGATAVYPRVGGGNRRTAR